MNNIEKIKLSYNNLRYLNVNDNNQLTDIELICPKLETLEIINTSLKVIKDSDLHELLDKYGKKYTLIEESKISKIL